MPATGDGSAEQFYASHGKQLIQIRVSDAFSRHDALARAEKAFAAFLEDGETAESLDFDSVGTVLRQLQRDGLLKDGTCCAQDGYAGFWESSRAALSDMHNLQASLQSGIRLDISELALQFEHLLRQLPTDQMWVPLARRSARNRSDLSRWRAHIAKSVNALHLACLDHVKKQQPAKETDDAADDIDEEEREYRAALTFVMKSGAGSKKPPEINKEELEKEFDSILKCHPYLDSEKHVLNIFVRKYRTHLESSNIQRAASCVRTLQTRMDLETQRLRAAFAKFDFDKSGVMDVHEFKNFAVYIGFGKDNVEKLCAEHDSDKDGTISFEEFVAFVGKEGGIEQLFSSRRSKLSSLRTQAGLEEGARVLAHFYEDGMRSHNLWDARIVDLDMTKQTAAVIFSAPSGVAVGMSLAKGPTELKQTIPLEVIDQDVDAVEALSALGVTDDDKMYWATLLPASETQVLKTLEGCQRRAIRHVRDLAAKNHEDALPRLVTKAAEYNIAWEDIIQTLTWLRDLAPVISHVDLDRYIDSQNTVLGRCLLEDQLFKNLFDVRTGGGCTSVDRRAGWEEAIFGGSYEETSHDDVPSKRPKYGVLDVCNDPRGVPAAWQYGDSYFILKNVRLRSTFANCDTSAEPDCAVLDQQAGVLDEYGPEELQEVVRVATAPEGSRSRIGDGMKITDYKEAQFHGLVRLDRDVVALVANERHRSNCDPFNPRNVLTYGMQKPAGPEKSESHFGEEEVKELCRKHGWKLFWMSDEASRRIEEVRGEL